MGKTENEINTRKNKSKFMEFVDNLRPQKILCNRRSSTV